MSSSKDNALSWDLLIATINDASFCKKDACSINCSNRNCSTKMNAANDLMNKGSHGT